MNGALGPVIRSRLNISSQEEVLQRMADIGMTQDQAKIEYQRLMRQEIWVTDEYQVNLDRDPPHGFPDMKVIHLSIKRIDKQPIHDWRDLQAIKDQMVAPEAEAIEIYPARSRVVDTSNQYHLWVLLPAKAGSPYPQIPIGWPEGLVLKESAHGAVQRPFP